MGPMGSVAWEPAMKIQEVILRAMAKRLTSSGNRPVTIDRPTTQNKVGHFYLPTEMASKSTTQFRIRWMADADGVAAFNCR
jgi:hypothetical protein